MKRRNFVKAASVSLGSALLTKNSIAKSLNTFGQINRTTKPIVISSGNGLRATEKAMELILKGEDALDACIAGVNIIEDDPNDHSVGYGGIPNEEGVVELDACCMHGPTHNAGGVASIQNIKNPSKVAKLVMERTDHVLIVGEGALIFAKAHGFKEENLLTEEAREIWLYWKESLSKNDDWFTPDGKDVPESVRKYFGITGTISCLGIDLNGNISGVTTTSGLSFKIPGRVGDSPIIGAGLYVDNEVGACGSTGRGEENLKNLSCFLVVEKMREGLSPAEACIEVLKRVDHNAKMPSLRNEKGLPNFGLTFYAINKNGEFGAASMFGPLKFSINENGNNRLEEAKYLYGW